MRQDFMLRSPLLTAFLLVCAWLVAAPASAQDPDLAGCTNLRSLYLGAVRFPVTTETGEVQMRLLLSGSAERPVQIDCDEMQLFADKMEVFDGHVLVATGNVLYVSQGNRVSAERLEFDTKTKLGAFHQAAGSASIANRVDRSLFGTQEPDAYFQGEVIEKLGPDTYKISHGWFTTCVQPTPRWQMVAGSVTLKLDDHALLTNAVLRVKGVPVMYLPIFYYPVQEDDRASGFLIPAYGTSTIKGQSISNAFFWAISRSQDATFFHDYYSKTGQGFGSEYRYELGGGNRGSTTFNFLNEHDAEYQNDNGTTSMTPAGRSFQIRGALSQALPAGLRARANVDYYSDITVQQRYEQNIVQASNRTRNIGANLSGNWREYVLSATFDKADVFYGDSSVTSLGGLPRVNFSRGERPIGRSKVYFGVNGEYLTSIYRNESGGEVVADRGLTRVDVNPVVRFPFTRWQFLTVNSSLSWRGTYWTESLDATGLQAPEGVGRRFFDLSARVTGPVFTRIFNTPGRAYAERWKHVIEPNLVVQRVTAIDVFDRIVQNDPTDTIIGSVTRVTYGLNNRLYAKKTIAREILGVSINQSYYTDARASQYDAQYQSSFNGAQNTSHFSTVRIGTRVSPTAGLQGDFSTEWSPIVHTLTTLTASGTVSNDRLQLSAGWARRRFLPDLPGFDNEALANHDLNATATVHNPGNRLGGTYAFNYDLHNDQFRQQRFIVYYNAQCCGIAAEYQSWNIGSLSSLVLPQDRRFNVSFTLAGIGTFSNFFGVLGGQGR
jgi:LPS-assembly protein